MPLIPVHPSPHTIKELRIRAAYAAEWGLKAGGGGADQASKLDEILDEIASPKSGGRDLGNVILPPGIIEFQAKCLIDDLVGQRLIGACNTEATNGPRNWSPSWSSVGGTSVYWAGAVGGPVFEIHNVRNFFLEYLDIHLAKDSASNHAAIGIHWRNPSNEPGPGENGCLHVAIVSPLHGNTGMQFGDAGANNNNIDTFKSLFQHFKKLTTGVAVMHPQGLVWRFIGPSFTNVDTFFNFQQGGQLFLQNFHCTDDGGGAGRPGYITICQVKTGGGNVGQYRIDGGYIDRQASGQHVVIFDFYEAQDTCIGGVSGVALRVLTGTKVFDGTKPASFEVGNRNVVQATGCNLQDQPLVRFRGVPNEDRAPIVQVDACIVPSGYALGGEVVTCNEGGCAGDVILNNCQRNRELFSATVGQLYGVGSPKTHKDETVDSNANIINGFDGWPSTTATDFYNSVSGIGSWLGVTYQPDAYWRFDDPLGSTTLTDISGNGHNLAVNSTVQVAEAPLPYLERSANWSNKDAPKPVDTGLTADPTSDDLTFFGFAIINDLAAAQVMFSVDPGRELTIPRLWFGAIYTTADAGDMRITRSNGGASEIANFLSGLGRWFHFVFTWDATSKTIKGFINGIRRLSVTNTGLDDISPGKIIIGRNHELNGGTRPFRGHFSRVGILKGRSLSDKEATLLFLRSSTVVKRNVFRPAN